MCSGDLPQWRTLPSGAQLGCSPPALSPFWIKPREALQIPIPICQKCVTLMLQYPPSTQMLLFRVTLSPQQVWPCPADPCCWVKRIFFWHTDAFVQLALLFYRDRPQPCSSLRAPFLLGAPGSMAFSGSFTPRLNSKGTRCVFFFQWARLW